MFNVDKLVYTALKNDADVIALVSNRIAHGNYWAGGNYPAITFSEISNVPALNADDEEILTRLTIQVNAMTQYENLNPLVSAVEKVMLGLGFSRQSYNDLDEGSIKHKIMRFTITGKGD